MKKLLALVLFAAMIIGLAMPAMAVADIVLPTAPKAAIVIDGVLDDGYGDPYVLDKHRNDGDGATGKVWSAWNDTGIFYFIEVYDTTPNHEHGNAYERDNVEFFIDWNSAADDAMSAVDDNPAWQVRIASKPNEDGVQFTGNLADYDDEALKEGVHYVTKPLEGNDLTKGYIIEIWLPIAATEGSAKPLAEGARIFVDFQIADEQEEDGGRVCQVFIDPDDDDTDNQWQWPYAFRGVLPLGAAKAAPEPEQPDEPAPIEDVGGGDDVVVTTPIPQPSPTTGDSGLILLVLAIVLAGAFATVKRAGKNRA